MASFNKVILLGHLAQDPDLKHTKTGLSVCSVDIAVSRKLKEADGTSKADFFNVVFWKGQADVVCKYFKKGTPILVSGYLQIRTWVNPQGVKHFITEIIAEEISFVESGSKSSDTIPLPEASTITRGEKNGSAYPVPSFNSSEQVRFEEIPDDGSLPF